jgi:hypothetical protein
MFIISDRQGIARVIIAAPGREGLGIRGEKKMEFSSRMRRGQRGMRGKEAKGGKAALRKIYRRCRRGGAEAKLLVILP